jgi:hypothetical protein
MNFSVEWRLLAANSVWPALSLQRDSHVDIENEHEIGLKTVESSFVDAPHPLDAEATPCPLVSERRVITPVRDHPDVGFQCRSYDLGRQLGALCGKEHGLRPWGHVRAMKQQSSDFLAERGTPRLSHHDRPMSKLLEAP